MEPIVRDRRHGSLLSLCVAAALALAVYALGRKSIPGLAAYRALGALLVPFVAMRLSSVEHRAATSLRLALLSGGFLLLASTSLATSMNAGLSLISVADLVVGVSLLIAASQLPQRAAGLLAVAQVLLVLPIAGPAILEPFGRGLVFGHDIFPGRAEANMGGPSSLGSLLAAALPVASAVLVAGRGRATAILAWVAAIILIIALTATFSRGALVAGILGTVTACVLLRHANVGVARESMRHAWRRRFTALILVFVLTIPAYNAITARYAPPEYGVGVTPGAQTFEIARPIEGSDLTNASVRLDCWKTALRSIAARPLSGVGAGCFGIAFEAFGPDELKRHSAQKGFSYSFAYNDFLQMGAELGLPALAMFVFILAWVVGRAIPHRGRSFAGSFVGTPRLAALSGLLGSVIALGAHGLVDFPLHLPTHSTVLWVDLGLVAALSRGGGDPRGRMRPRRAFAALLMTAGALLALALALAAVLPLIAEREAVHAVELGERRDFAGAIRSARRATTLAGYEHGYWVVLAEAYLKAYDAGQGGPAELESAIDSYRGALRARPHSAPIHGRIAAIYLSYKDPVPAAVDSALVHLRRSIALNPYFADPHTNLGTVLASLGRAGDAEREFLIAAELDTTDADPLFNLGNLETVRGRRAEAISRYVAALEREPDHLGTLINLATLLLAEGRRAEVVDLLERAVENHPASEAAAVLLAAARGDGADGRGQLARAGQSTPLGRVDP